jgi:beta-glucosidase
MLVETARTKVMVSRSSMDIRLTATFPVRGTVIGTRRAADHPIRAVDSDEYSGTVTTDAGVQAAENGAWLCFQGVDTSGYARRASTATRNGERARGRPVLESAAGVPGAGAAHFDDPGRRVHDVYVVFDSAGTTITGLVCER